MKAKLTFLIISTASAATRQFSISKFFLLFLTLIFVMCGTLLGGVIYDYVALKKTAFNVVQLNDAISEKDQIIAFQRNQIKVFANKINSLKDKIVDLDSFEKKIRVIANIDENSVIAIGGIPDDLNPDLDSKGQQNRMMQEMHEQIDFIDENSGKQRESLDSLLKYLEDQKNLLASTPSIWPVEHGHITSKWGRRKSPFTGRYEFHSGLDIANKIGTPIIATADGVVIFTGKKGLLGNLVEVDHGHGVVTRYAHMLKIKCKKNQKVKRGDTLGAVGNTGRSTGPHLHYEVRLNGVSVNPVKYILN